MMFSLRRAVWCTVCVLSLGPGVLLTGCGGGSGKTPPAPPPPVPAVAIASPANGSVSGTSKVPLTLKVTGGADPTKLVVHLNGEDVSATFSPADGTGTRTVILDAPHILFGVNQLKVEGAGKAAKSRFYVDLRGAATPSASMPRYVSVTTRKVTGDPSQAGSYSIQVGDTSYPAAPAPDGSAVGIQILLLSRADLTPEVNTTVGTAVDWSGVQPALAAASQNCPIPTGCIVIAQSLQTMGATPCGSSEDPTACSSPNPFATIGGSNASSFVTSAVGAQAAYSYIGNSVSASVGQGTFFERLTCSTTGCLATNPVFPLGLNLDNTAQASDGPSGVGKITGALILDGSHHYNFTQIAPPVTFSTGETGTGALTNTMVVNGVAYPSAPVNGGGFQVLILDRTTLAQVTNLTYEIGNDNLPGMLTVLDPNGPYQSARYLFFIASIGNIAHPAYSSAAGIWYTLGEYIGELGGTFHVFATLDYPFSYDQNDDYSVVGHFPTTGPGSSRYFAPEASSRISRETLAITPLPASNINGILTMDNQGYYTPQLYGSGTPVPTGTGVPNVSYVAGEVAPNAPWPVPVQGSSGQQNAYASVSQVYCSCDDVRSVYTSTIAFPNSWASELDVLPYETIQTLPGSSLPFSKQDYQAVQSQLVQEFNYANYVVSTYANTQNFYTSSAALAGLGLFSDFTGFLSNLQFKQATSVAKVDTGLVRTYAVNQLENGAAVVGFGGEVKGVIESGELFRAFVGQHTTTPQGTPLEQTRAAEYTAASNLAQEISNNYTAELLTAAVNEDMILNDWGKLQAVGQNQIMPTSETLQHALDAYNRALQTAILIRLDQAVGLVGVNYNASSGQDPYETNPQYRTDVNVGFYADGPTAGGITTGNDGLSYDGYLLLNANNISAGGVTSWGLTLPYSATDSSQLGFYRGWFFLRNYIPTQSIGSSAARAGARSAAHPGTAAPPSAASPPPR